MCFASLATKDSTSSRRNRLHQTIQVICFTILAYQVISHTNSSYHKRVTKSPVGAGVATKCSIGQHPLQEESRSDNQRTQYWKGYDGSTNMQAIEEEIAMLAAGLSCRSQGH